MTANTGPTSNSLIKMAPMAGPMTREVLNMALLRATALGRSSSPTISLTKAWRTGMSIGAEGAEHEGQQVDGPQRVGPGQGDDGQGGRADRHARLRHDQGAPLGQPVGDDAAVGAEQQHGQELQGGDDAHRRTRCW